MDVLRIYESLRDAGINESNLQELVQGYKFYLERRKMGWVPIEPPCRLVYRTKDPFAMVAMPFLIPEYADKIWGISVCGVYFSLTYKEVKTRPEKGVMSYLDEMSERMFGENYWMKRRLELPTYSNFMLLRKFRLAIDDTFTLLTILKEALNNANPRGSASKVRFSEFGESRYWISDKSSEVPLVTKFDGQQYLPPFEDKRAKIRPVLHADARLDVFCAIDNKFATPKKEKFETCMLKLSEE